MDDLVSREAVKKWLERWDGYIDMDIIRRMQYRVIDIPYTQLERKKGRWIEDPSGYGFWICSACGFISEASCADLLYNFCPHCGVDMRGESE